jgi:two-component system, response regulator PdtaR
MTPIKVLLVEDQQVVVLDIEALLTDWGYEFVGSAATGAEAISMFEELQPDLAIVDINIEGDMDGIETVKRFNSIRPIPIVYLTAQSDSKTVQRAKASNPFAFLLKPFDERSLQISLEVAFDMFDKHKETFFKVEDAQTTAPANEVKLNADMILQNEDSIFVKQNYRFVKLKKDELLIIEADRNHAVIYTKQHKYVVRMPLVTVLERLQNDKLVRVHRSYAVNVKYVDEFNESELLINGKKIPFSQVYRDSFLSHFNII